MSAESSTKGLPSLVLERRSVERPDPIEALGREWLVTNGLGGYASGTLSLCPTRRYHGLFVPSLERFGRTVMLARVEEEVAAGGSTSRLDAAEGSGGWWEMGGLEALRRFQLEGLVPEWTYQVGGASLARRLMLVHGENTFFLFYRHLGGPELRLRLRLFSIFRPHDAPLGQAAAMEVARVQPARLELSRSGEPAPALRLQIYSARPAPFTAAASRSPELLFRMERARGYDFAEVQDSPGYIDAVLSAGETLVLGGTCEGWAALERDPADAFSLELQREQRLLDLASPPARSGTAARLVLAADQFLIEPRSRARDQAWAHSADRDLRTVIAGYPWFTDWGRDTMISLEGLTLSTGRVREAAALLRTFQHYVRHGLLPNLFPEGESEGLYHTADATLWYFHALDRYVAVSGNASLLAEAFPTLEEIVAEHLRGTLFQIGVDPADGLLRQGAEGYQLTWMDAKVDGWVVTPRRGKAVEINALWFNALRLMARWSQQLGRPPRNYAEHSQRAEAAFNLRFWNERQQCLLDVVDGEQGDDPAVRPNQIFAVSLPHPVLRADRWKPVVDRVKAELLTPVGLRSLSPSHRDYKAEYDGDLRARDAAYHQGTVWGWLIGPFVDAYLRVYPDRPQARAMLSGLEAQLREACVGQVSEIFDAREPFHPRGCFAQAWSVAELLRVWRLTEG